MRDYFLCENEKCKHRINYNMKYMSVVDEEDPDPVCSYCGEKMTYSYTMNNGRYERQNKKVTN